MADSVVSFVLDNLSQLLKHEASMLVGVEDHIESLRVDLGQINQFLQDSKGKREMVKELLSLIRKVAHRAEDVIDRYVINMAKHKRRNTLLKFRRSLEHTTMLRTVAKDIQSIRNEIAIIYSSREKYITENKGASDDYLEDRRKLNRHTKSSGGTYNMNEDGLAEEMRKLLQGKRYLIVLDDVWDTEVWDAIKDAFPDNMNGCRILVTSRLNDVALYVSRTPPYSLRVLDKNNSWELFSKKAFHGEDCPPGLEIYGRKMVEKCNGLPLAIIVLAGQLAQRERSPRIWSQMADKVSWKVEDVADKYLEDLVDRNLVMVSQRRCDGGVKSCFIHDLLHDLCIFECRQENFLVVLTDEVFTSSSASTSTDTTTGTRRLSAHCSTSRFINFVHYDSSRVHSLLCFGDPCELSNRNFKSLYRKFQLLRVLDLGSTTVLGVPTKVEELIHLRYLRMNAPQLSEIPSCISNLPKLQTLDLRESKIKYFTKNFWKMQRLRHLFISADCDLTVMDRNKEVKPMRSLKTLSTISSNAAYLLEGDTVFPNLRKLGLQVSQSSSYSQTNMAKPNFSSVRILKIMEGSHFLSHEGVLPSSLTKLTLLQTKIKLPVFEMLAKLQHLEILKLLKKSLAEESIDCKEGWFPALQVLHMVELDLKKWTFQQIKMQNEEQKWITHDRDVMQSLRYLLISKCRDLTDNPEELKRENVQYEFQS
ncbi:hypothetical protein LguiA_033516 [Lonicera macranthoides]